MGRYFSVKGRLLSLFFFLILLTASAHAQEAKRNLIYTWDNFSGGLFTKASPFLLERTQADICENIRLGDEFGSIQRRDEVLLYGTADTSEPITGMHRLYLADGTKVLLVTHGSKLEKGTDSTGAFTELYTVTTGDYRFQALTWNNVAIFTDGQNHALKYDGSSASATVLGACLATDAGSGTGLNGNSYKYKVSFYTTSYDVDLGVVSNVISVASKDVSVSMIPLGPDTYGGEAVVGRRIYRTTLAAPTTYYYAKTIADNTTTSYTDSTGDAALGTQLGTYQAITTTYTPATGELCVVHKNRLWIANNSAYPSRIYYSEDGNHDVFGSASYFDIRPDDGDEITFAKNLLGGLWIGKNNTIQRMYTEGTDPASDWGYSAPYSFIGCQAKYSAVTTPLGIFYLNKAGEGLYKFNGHSSSLVSDKITPTIKDISDPNFTNSWGELHENKYYLAYTSHETGATTNDRVLVYDLIDDTFTIDLLSRNAFCVFGSGTDWGVLYSGASDDGRVYAHAITTLQMVHKRHGDFDGTFTRMRYIPTTIGGDADSPVLEICRHATIDALTGTINAMTGDINRSDANGNYVSSVQHLNAFIFVKLYWNELMTSTGGATTEVLFYVRASDTVAKCRTNDWSSSFTDPSGSDISGEPANTYVQYRIEMSSSAVDYTPLLRKVGGYVTRLTYNQQGAKTESTIPLTYRTGWTNLGYPGYIKSLKKVYCFHESEEETGTLELQFENYKYGETDTFEIDLSTNPTEYEEYFTDGKFTGEKFRLNISENSLNDLKIREILVIFDVEPLY